MKKLFSLFAAVLFAGSMMADSYTITFKDNGAGSSDATTSLTSTNVADYVAEGADYVSAVAVSGKVYNGQEGYGLKFGNSSNPGSVTLTLATAVTPTSIVMNASPWSATEGAGLLQDSVYETKSTGAKGTFADFAYEYDGATQVTTIIVGTSTKRGYVKSITVNYGEVTPVEPETIPTTAPAVPAQAEADVMAIYCNHYTTNNAHFGISGWAGGYQTLDLDGTMAAYWTGMTWECIIDPVNTDAAHDFSAYENIHVDMWAPAAAKIKFTAEAVAGGNYKDGQVLDLVQGWNSFDIALANWAGNYDFANLKCFCLEQYQTPAGESFEGNPFAIANIYFWNTPALADPTNCAEAREAALSVSGNNVYYKDSTVYTIEGYVTGIKTAYSDQYHNISFWMADAADGGEVLQAYRAACASAEAAPVVGDKVQVTGALTKYNTTPEFGAGCTFVITEPYIPVEPEINYYVAGSMGVWGPDEAYKLTPSNNGEYEGEFTFAANDEFKVIGYDGTTVTWFPEGMDNNYVITEAGDYKITFNPAGNVEGWYEGFFNVVKKEVPIVHQYEVAEAIAAGLTDDTEILVRGVITKMEFKGKNFAKYGSVNIYVADATDAEGEFEFYNCYSLEADTFRTSTPAYDPESTAWAQFREVVDGNGNAIHVGDTVIAFGKYKLYNSTHELNTGCYLVDIKHAPVAPADTITIDIESEVAYTDAVATQGWWQFMAENEDYEISLSNNYTTQAAGVYTIADMDASYTYVYVKATETKVGFVDGQFTLTEGADGSRTIVGLVTGEDGNIYDIKLVYNIPTPETTVNVEIPMWGVADASQYYSITGYIFYGTAADSTYVQITIPGNNPIGTFTEDDCYMSGTGIEVGKDYKSIYSINVTVELTAENRPIITADILCLNNTLYHVTTPYGEGFESVEAAVKAVKKLINGNVVIEKAGVRYSINGQVIR